MLEGREAEVPCISVKLPGIPGNSHWAGNGVVCSLAVRNVTWLQS